MTHIAENLALISSEITRCERLYDRKEDSVQLLAVSKKHSPELIRLAFDAGIANFGENYLQEALGKIDALASLPLTWHFIGPIQSNKTRGIAEHFSWVHSVDRAKIATRLNEHRPEALPALNICAQVKLSLEESKSGVKENELFQLCHTIDDLPNLNLRGLMVIPQAFDSLSEQRRVFRQLAKLFEDMRLNFPTMDTLSMGMSNDFEAAIAEGSTMIRIGTGIFGQRPST